MYIHLHFKISLFLSDFKENLIFSTHIRQVLNYQILWKSYSGSQVVPYRCTDRQVDGQKGRQTCWS